MDSLQEAFIHPPELCEARFVMDVLYLTTFELLNKKPPTTILTLTRAKS